MLSIGLIRLRDLRFPDRAGELQDAGAIPALIAELGDNYEIYHDHLASALDVAGAYPERSHYRDLESYLADCDRAQQIVLAEALLRTCKAYRQGRRSLAAPLDTSTPLLGPDRRLVSSAG